MKTARQNPSTGANESAQRTVSSDSYINGLTCKFHAGYKRQDEPVMIPCDATNA